MNRFGRRTAPWLTIGVTALLVQACTERPGAPGARIYAVDMAGGARSCVVPRVVPAAGHETPVTMKVGNDGGWCAITVNDAGRPFAAGLLIDEPAHGEVVIHTVGDNTRIDYTPSSGFAGSDAFVVRLIPGNATIRAAVSVGRS